MKVKPLGNRALIKPVVEEKRTEGGIVLPDSAKEKPQKALVVEVGNLEDIDLKAGDKVLFSKYAGTEITIDDENHIVIDATDILAKIED
jgi:chaperonin GroES